MTKQQPNKQNPHQPNRPQTTQPQNRPQTTTHQPSRPQTTPPQNWSWDEREDEQPIEFDGDTEEICRGCTVELEHDGTRVAVEVQNNKGNTWTGRITGFPTNEDETHIGNLKVGNTITFEERHIFRCAA